MKALSVKQPWANLIKLELKTIETRTWKTQYRGDLLICAGKSPAFELPENICVQPLGAAVCIAELYEIEEMTAEHEDAAMCDVYPGAYSWFLRNIRPIEQFPVQGRQKLFEVNFHPQNEQVVDTNVKSR